MGCRKIDHNVRKVTFSFLLTMATVAALILALFKRNSQVYSEKGDFLIKMFHNGGRV